MYRPPEKSDLSLIDRFIRMFLENKLVVLVLLVLMVGWGLMTAPFDWHLWGLPRTPVPVDAIPDIGENQQIVFTEWMGRSPQDVEDQITYPLTVSLLGIPGVRTIRSFSFFGFSTIYVIFREDIDFYWSRTRILEKLNSLPSDSLPQGVRPALGPDATPLGQIFWYTLEGMDDKGRPTGGWDLHELRTLQDWYVRYALMAAEGVSEVASVGGFEKEYQIDVDPDAMRAFGVGLDEIFQSVKMSNLDVGARTIEINRVEYIIRGLGLIKSLEDIEDSVIRVRDNVPVRIRDVAHVTLGPALRRGALDKKGAEVVGGVVVVRYGENPLSTIRNVKKKIEEISAGLPRRTLADGTVSRIKIVPFYDRTQLIHETLGTLETALIEEILVTAIVIVLMVAHLRSSVLISGLLPLAVLMSFIAMKQFGVDANIVALSGIAIAIGTIVDMGIVICVNILTHLRKAPPEADRKEVVFQAAREVGSAVLTAVATTVVGFLPVFTMTGAEGKLFNPLACTKTFALVASIIIALAVIPSLAQLLFVSRDPQHKKKSAMHWLTAFALTGFGVFFSLKYSWWIGLLIVITGLYYAAEPWLPPIIRRSAAAVANGLVVLIIALVLTRHWLPLGPARGLLQNFIFVALGIGGLLALFFLFRMVYPLLLGFFLRFKTVFLLMPLLAVLWGVVIWLGFDDVFSRLPHQLLHNRITMSLSRSFPGLGREFMPPLDEGSFLFMPTTMPHASIGEALDVLQKQDKGFAQVPEIESVVGKLGRVDSALDPAPVSMIETVINYKPEYVTDADGNLLRFRYDPDDTDLFRDVTGYPVTAPDGKPYTVQGRFERDDTGGLIPDARGRAFRLWRPPLDPGLNDNRNAWSGIRTPDDIWKQILRASEIPGTTSAPKLQPIFARIVMLQSGMRAPMGVKVKGPDLETIEKTGLQIEQFLKEVPSIEPATVIADRVVGKPYLEIDIDRKKIARYGLQIKKIQTMIESAVGGRRITTTVEGRERYGIRVRYLRELRDSIESLGTILIPAADGSQIPLKQLADIRYARGPQAVKSEDTFLVGYVVFDKKPGVAEVDVVEEAWAWLREKIESGEWELPAGVSYHFAGSYENQVRARKTLSIILPLALLIIFMILYFQFHSVLTTLMVFSGILVAWSGGFILIWLYSRPWFLDFSLFDVSMRELFQVHPINLSVAVWVGFLALFGIASDDGVLMATYLDQRFAIRKASSIREIRESTRDGALQRIRPALMTSATTILALVPVLTSTGRGADIMIPMAIPSFGGMLMELLTLFVVPVLYCSREELRFRIDRRRREKYRTGPPPSEPADIEA